MTTSHKHADILRALADGKQVQDLGADKAGAPCYINVVNEHALRVIASGGGAYLRIAPETITVNGVECPKPLNKCYSDKPVIGVTRYAYSGAGCCEQTCFGFETEADARTVFDALCKPFKADV